MNEIQQATKWFEKVDLSGITEAEGIKVEFFKYDICIGIYKGVYYLTTKSPQAKSWRRSLGDLVAKGANKDELRAGYERFIANMAAKIERRQAKTNAKREARKSFVIPYKVGDFLYSSWGYEQTNREFYQVLEIGNNSLKLQEVYQNRERTNHDQGICSPVRDSFKGDAFWVTIQIRENYHSVPSPIHGNLYAYEGKPVYFSDGY